MVIRKSAEAQASALFCCLWGIVIGQRFAEGCRNRCRDVIKPVILGIKGVGKEVRSSGRKPGGGKVSETILLRENRPAAQGGLGWRGITVGEMGAGRDYRGGRAAGSDQLLQSKAHLLQAGTAVCGIAGTDPVQEGAQRSVEAFRQTEGRSCKPLLRGLLQGDFGCERKLSAAQQTVQDQSQGIHFGCLGIPMLPVDLRGHIGRGSPQVTDTLQFLHRKRGTEISQHGGTVGADKQIPRLDVQVGNTCIPAASQSPAEILRNEKRVFHRHGAAEAVFIQRHQVVLKDQHAEALVRTLYIVFQKGNDAVTAADQLQHGTFPHGPVQPVQIQTAADHLEGGGTAPVKGFVNITDGTGGDMPQTSGAQAAEPGRQQAVIRGGLGHRLVEGEKEMGQVFGIVCRLPEEVGGRKRGCIHREYLMISPGVLREAQHNRNRTVFGKRTGKVYRHFTVFPKEKQEKSIFSGYGREMRELRLKIDRSKKNVVK